MRAFSVLTSTSLLFVASVHAQEPMGIFDNHMDLGNPAPGEASFDAESGEYLIEASGGGKHPGSEQTDFHLVYSEISGNFRIKGQVSIENLDGTNNAAWAALAVTDVLEGTAVLYTVGLRVDGYGFAMWKSSPGPRYEFKGMELGTWPYGLLLPSDHDGQFELVRQGNTFRSYYVDPASETQILYDERTIEMEDPVYVGLLAGSWDEGRYCLAYFTNVELVAAAPSSVDDWHVYD